MMTLNYDLFFLGINFSIIPKTSALFIRIAISWNDLCFNRLVPLIISRAYYKPHHLAAIDFQDKSGFFQFEKNLI